MTRLGAANPPSTHRGQVLPVFALFLIVLLGLAALAIDVSSALSARRYYRSVADAAALAGGQDLQRGTTRVVTATERTYARTHAMSQLVSLLGATAPTCDPTANIADCALPGTPYLVSVTTPSPTCVACLPERSIQVTVRDPTYQLSFARLFGQPSWNVATTSVAGLEFGKSYAIETLRPPKKLGSTFDVKDITIDGGSIVTVSVGDVGSNSNMTYSGSGSRLILNPDYGMYYFDPLSGPLWGVDPAGVKIPKLIPDPNYRYPDMTGAPVYTDARASQADLPSTGSPPSRAVTRASTDPQCKADAVKVDATLYTFMATTADADIYCYNPGIYQKAASGPDRAQIVVASGAVAILRPGAYYLKSGLDVSGRLIGGYEPGKQGVAVMFDECLNTCIFSGNNAPVIALNAGTKFPPGTAGIAATPARDWTNQLVQTSGPDSPTPPLIITLLVKKDPACYVPTSAPYVEPTACDALKDKSINIAGNGFLALEGVQYVPTDNVEISGNSGTTGSVGQIISWTLKYSGGIRINQEGPANEGPGILRLDAACTTPLTPCTGP